MRCRSPPQRVFNPKCEIDFAFPASEMRDRLLRSSNDFAISSSVARIRNLFSLRVRPQTPLSDFAICKKLVTVGVFHTTYADGPTGLQSAEPGSVQVVVLLGFRHTRTQRRTSENCKLNFLPDIMPSLHKTAHEALPANPKRLRRMFDRQD